LKAKYLAECAAIVKTSVKSVTSSDRGGFVVVESKMMQVMR
jgi:hypothetical protein